MSIYYIDGAHDRVHLYVIRYEARTSDGQTHNLRSTRERSFSPTIRIGSLLATRVGYRKVVDICKIG